MDKKRILLCVLLVGCIGCSSPDFDVWKADHLARFSKRTFEKTSYFYKRALTRLPTSKKREKVRIKLGRLYYEQGNFEKAVEILRGANDMESVAAKRLLAFALYKSSDFTGALDVFNQLGELDDPEYLFIFGQTLEKSNLYDQAIKLYSGIKDDPLFGLRASERLHSINLMTAKLPYAGIDSVVRQIIEESPGLEAYPEASALLLFVGEDITLTEDNKAVFDMHFVIKILNDRGKENFGEVTLSYDSTYDKLELEYARTIKADGTVVTVGDKNIRDVSIYLNFPLYSNARARIISMPEVAEGCIIEYKAKLTRSSLPNKKDIYVPYSLASDEPILKERLKFRIPKDRSLHFKLLNQEYNDRGFDMNPKVEELGQERVYSLEFNDVAQIIPEPMMPATSKINPIVWFSTFDSWQDIYDWWKKLYQDKIVADEDIKAKVQELIKDKESELDRIKAIYNFVTQDIRYVAVEYGDAGYEPHQASEIFKNKYGDCKDKAILLIAMLAEISVEAYPVLIGTSEVVDLQRDLPSLAFNHAIAAIEREGKLIFMDSTGMTVSFGDLPLGDQDRDVLVFYKDQYKIVKTPLFEPEHNKRLVAMRIEIQSDESISASRQVEASGVYQQSMRGWLKFTMPILIEEMLKERIRDIAKGALLGEYTFDHVNDLNTPVFLSYNFKAPEYLTKAGLARILPQLGSMDTSIVVLDKRKYPIEFLGFTQKEQRIEFALPSEFEVEYLPEFIEVNTQWFYFLSQYELLPNNVLRYVLLHEIKEKRVAVVSYLEYRKAIESLASKMQQHVILKKKE